MHVRAELLGEGDVAAELAVVARRRRPDRPAGSRDPGSSPSRARRRASSRPGSGSVKPRRRSAPSAKRGKFCDGTAAAPGTTMISPVSSDAVAVACRSTAPSPWSRASRRGTPCPVRPENATGDPDTRRRSACRRRPGPSRPWPRSDRAARSCDSPIGSPFCTAMHVADEAPAAHQRGRRRRTRPETARARRSSAP